MEITDLGFGKYKVSFNVTDKNEFMVKCFDGAKETEVYYDNGYYFYATGDEIVKAGICATDAYGYVHEKYIEAHISDTDKNDFFKNNTEYKIFRPLVKFVKNTSECNEVKDGIRTISIDTFN